jgi:hypothetical protein
MNGRCVSRMPIMTAVPQNADSPGESCSTIRHHSSTTSGSRKCSPVRTTGHVSGSRTTGADGSSSSRSGEREANQADAR